MCRLFAYTGANPCTPRSVLGAQGTAELLELSHEHCHGWGQASKSAHGFSCTRIPEAAYTSSAFTACLDHPVYSTMIHLRQASSAMSKKVVHNHPFVSGHYAFCHNGYFQHHEKIINFLHNRGIEVPYQATDTEAYFALMRYYAHSYSIPEALKLSAQHILSVCGQNWLALNALVMDDKYLYAFNFYRADSPLALAKPTRYKMHYQSTDAMWAVGSEGFSFRTESSKVHWMKQGQILRVSHQGTGLTDVTPHI